jgi:hypothetical protein
VLSFIANQEPLWLILRPPRNWTPLVAPSSSRGSRRAEPSSRRGTGSARPQAAPPWGGGGEAASGGNHFLTAYAAAPAAALSTVPQAMSIAASFQLQAFSVARFVRS